MKIRLCDQNGNNNDEPSAANVLAVLKQTDDEWNEGCGQAALSDGPIENGGACIIFYGDSKYGYVLLDGGYTAPIDEKKDAKLIVVHDVGGEPFPVPSCFFISYEQAEQILLHFLKTGEILNHDEWRDIYEDFDFDSYLDSDEYANGVTEFRIG